MDISNVINNLQIKFMNEIMKTAWQRYQDLPEQRQKQLLSMYNMHLADQEIFPLPGAEFKNFEHYLSNILMKKKEHSFRKWLEEQGYQTKKTKPGQFKIVGYENKHPSL